MRERLERRVRELLLPKEQAEFYIAIYENGGVCPKCEFNTEGYEHKVCSHIRRCESQEAK